MTPFPSNKYGPIMTKEPTVYHTVTTVAGLKDAGEWDVQKLSSVVSPYLQSCSDENELHHSRTFSFNPKIICIFTEKSSYCPWSVTFSCRTILILYECIFKSLRKISPTYSQLILNSLSCCLADRFIISASLIRCQYHYI